MQNRMIPHIQESTLPVALAKVRAEMPDVPNFTIHDFRRTARTHLAALGVDPVVAERCLNHRIKGVEGFITAISILMSVKLRWHSGLICWWHWKAGKTTT